MKRKTYVCVLLLLIFSHALFAQDYSTASRFVDNYFFRSRDIRVDYNKVYGEALNHKGKMTEVEMDVFYPNPEIDPLSKKPLILLLHGGFGNSDKSVMYKYCPLLAQRGFVVATANFRDSYQGTIDYQPGDSILASTYYRSYQDIHAALRYLSHHSKKYGIDPNAIILGGKSAGAGLALIFAYMDQQEFNAMFPWIEETLGRLDESTNNVVSSFRIIAAIDMWGQIHDTAAISREEAQAIPLIMFHGTADSSVSTYNKSIQIADRFKELGGCYQLHSRTGAGHGEDMSKYYIAAKTGCFIKDILCNTCETLEREINNDDVVCDDPLPVDREPMVRKATSIDSDKFRIYSGSYRLINDEGKKQTLSIQEDGDHLFLSAGKDLWYELLPESVTDFYCEEDNLQISFKLNPNGRVTGLWLYIDAKEIHARKKK